MRENSPGTIHDVIYSEIDAGVPDEQSEISPQLALLYIQLLRVTDIVNKLLNKDFQAVAPGVVDVLSVGALGLFRAIKKQLGLP